ncbi:MAG TPA: haloacid dehalogenase [Chloroflexi bacterium]|nr:haloacid dehalogenase [Chloroflexota bacterium]
MDHLEDIADQIREEFDAQNDARDRALSQTRTLTRHCAHAIRAVHRMERQNAAAELEQAGKIVEMLITTLKNDHPNLYFAGYTQDALKEYAEARIVYALVDNEPLPNPQELELEPATYLRGLAEAVGELRRRILDILRGGHSTEAERLLKHMDEIYAVLVTMDYPDAVTYGLRRQTDICRSIIERTRGDMTLSFRQHQLEETIRNAEENFLTANGEDPSP